MSGYVYWCNAVVPAEHVAIADAFGALIGSEPGDAQAFSRGIKLRQVGGPNTVAAYGVAVAIKAGPCSVIGEFNGSGPRPTLNGHGVTDEQIAQAKAVISVEAGQRADLESNARAFWAAHGYEPVVITLGVGT